MFVHERAWGGGYSKGSTLLPQCLFVQMELTNSKFLKLYLAQLFNLADLVRHWWRVHLHVDAFCWVRRSTVQIERYDKCTKVAIL